MSDAVQRISNLGGWPGQTNVFEVSPPIDEAGFVAVSIVATSIFEDGQAQVVPCDEKGRPANPTIQAIWWAAGTFTHAEVLTDLGYTITDPPDPEES